MDTSVEHEARKPETSRRRGSTDRRERGNHRPKRRAHLRFRSVVSNASTKTNANTDKAKQCQPKRSLKELKASTRLECVHQSREQKQRTAMRRSYSRPSEKVTTSSSQALVFRSKSCSRNALSMPLSKRIKLMSSRSNEDCAMTEQSTAVVRTDHPPAAQRPTKRSYFRRPSRYKRRNQLKVTSKLMKSSDVSKNASSKVEMASGWEQNSTKFSVQECHEAFIKAFAIPTHLYRYLAQRHRQRPLFLDRNLSYLRAPSSAPRLERSQRPSVNTVVERLRGQTNRVLSSSKLSPKQDLSVELFNALGISNPSPPHWPQEVQMIFEGFYDSEKELDWITVDASVNLLFRFGWSWRHKVCPSDTLISPCQAAIPLTCHNAARGFNHPPPNSSNTPTDCRFCPLDVIEQAKWITSGSRLSCGQLELRVTAVERRWLKRRDLSRASTLSNGATTTASSTEDKSLDREQSLMNGAVSTFKGKPGLSGASYPVYYATAPLPLFYPSTISGSLHQSHAFLLTPGLYELRLGVDHGVSCYSGLPDKSTLDGRRLPNGSGMENGAHDAASTTDSLVTSTSEFPSGTACSMDEVSSLTSQNSAAASGRVEWRRVRFPRASDALDEYSRWPTLKFRVVWHGEATRNEPEKLSFQLPVRNGIVMNGSKDGRVSLIKTLPINISSRSSLKSPTRRTSAELSPLKTELQSLNGVPPETQTNGVRARLSAARTEVSSEPMVLRPVAYRFLYMGHLQQWSESKNLICPWCQLDCGRARTQGLEALLIHLRSTHPRFRFKAIWGAARSHLSLEVSLNEAYDGSNDCGLRRWAAEDGSSGRALVAPGQLLGGWTGLGLTTDRETNAARSLSLAGCATRVSRPIRRLPYTHLIFWRGTERSINQPLDPTLSVRPMAVGHNRVYYHTRSIQPIRACEFDVDSEAEDAPVWLCQHYQRKVEEFTDVNQGEKQIMQLWNSLLLSIGPSQLVVCDNQLVNLCTYFLHRYAISIHRRRLRNNLLLHFANLVDYGLLSAGQLRQLITVYDKLIATHTSMNSGNPGSRALNAPSINGTTTNSSSTGSQLHAVTDAAAQV